MKIYASTKLGAAKTENEDRVIINDTIICNGDYELETDKATVAIADGVGGNNAGAIASDFIAVKLSKTYSINKNVFVLMNTELIQKSKVDNELHGMATTLSGIAKTDKQISLFHIGNTRISVMQGNYLKQITEDHTTVNWLIKTGKITQSDAETYDKRNEITACFGGNNANLMCTE